MSSFLVSIVTDFSSRFVSTPASIRRVKIVDPQHPNLVALSQGSVVLFAVTPPAAPVSRTSLLNVRQLSPGLLYREPTTEAGKLAFKPFQAIGEEQYRLYHEVIA